MFEEEQEVVWEKGGSGLVFYTDAAYWRSLEEAGTVIAKQKQPGCKKSARPIRSHKYKRPKTLISSKAKKLNILLRILLLE